MYIYIINMYIVLKQSCILCFPYVPMMLQMMCVYLIVCRFPTCLQYLFLVFRVRIEQFNDMVTLEVRSSIWCKGCVHNMRSSEDHKISCQCRQQMPETTRTNQTDVVRRQPIQTKKTTMYMKAQYLYYIYIDRQQPI